MLILPRSPLLLLGVLPAAASFAALPQRLRGLVIHRHRHIGVMDARPGREGRKFRQFGANLGLAAEQQEEGVGVPFEGLGRARDDNGRAVIAPHGIQRNGDGNARRHRDLVKASV